MNKHIHIGIVVIVCILLYTLAMRGTSYFNFKTSQCGKEGHFSHSSGGGLFSWEAIKINGKNRYLFIMFESYLDGTSDHYVMDVINLPTMNADTITVNGKQGILKINGNSISKPDTTAMATIKKAKQTFFDMLICNDDDNREGKGTQ